MKQDWMLTANIFDYGVEEQQDDDDEEEGSSSSHLC
jgi:hypothetical protein